MIWFPQCKVNDEKLQQVLFFLDSNQIGNSHEGGPALDIWIVQYFLHYVHRGLGLLLQPYYYAWTKEIGRGRPKFYNDVVSQYHDRQENCTTITKIIIRDSVITLGLTSLEFSSLWFNYPKICKVAQSDTLYLSPEPLLHSGIFFLFFVSCSRIISNPLNPHISRTPCSISKKFTWFFP